MFELCRPCSVRRSGSARFAVLAVALSVSGCEVDASADVGDADASSDAASDTPGGATLDTPEAIKAAEVYNNILKQADPGSLGWDWNGVAEAMAAGDLARSPQWHEYASMFQDPTKSKVVDKVKWALLPGGPAGSKNLWGGTGLAINGYASEELQRAAWLFILWATSPEVQKALLLEGATPTRTSVYQDPEVLQ